MNILEDFLRPATLHIYGKNEHVGIVERSIQTIKERCRCMCNSVPFKSYTKLMTKHLVDTAVYWLNSFPSENGISATLSPGNIVLGRSNADFSKPKIAFGTYAFVYTGTNNTMKSRSVPGIALGPSNEWGGHYFMSLYTGKRLHSYHWKSLPMDKDVIDRVHELASAEKQPITIDGMPLFEWNIGVPIDDIDDDTDDDDTSQILNHDIQPFLPPPIGTQSC